MRAAQRDRILGAALLGVIASVLTSAVICGFNPIGGSIHDLGILAMTGAIAVTTLVWVCLFYGALTLLARRRE